MTGRRTRPRRVGPGDPVHLVLDNEGLAQLQRARPTPALLVALQGAVDSDGVVVLPTSVLLERDLDRQTPGAALVNHRLREVMLDPLDAGRAGEAVRLRVGSGERGSVVDAHVAATALAAVRRFGGRAMIATSDPGDLTRLLGTASEYPRDSVGVHRL